MFQRQALTCAYLGRGICLPALPATDCPGQGFAVRDGSQAEKWSIRQRRSWLQTRNTLTKAHSLEDVVAWAKQRPGSLADLQRRAKTWLKRWR